MVRDETEGGDGRPREAFGGFAQDLLGLADQGDKEVRFKIGEDALDRKSVV